MIDVAVLEKYWSEPMFTNVIEVIGTKRTVFRSTAKRWAHKEILKEIDRREGLEYING